MGNSNTNNKKENKSNNSNYNIYIIICYCLEESKLNIKDINFKEFTQELANEFSNYSINKEKILSNENNSFLANDEIFKNIDINFECIEYAPKIFAYLRSLDKISNDDIIRSFLPMFNENIISKNDGGRSGNLFLGTNNNKYLLKTISLDELNFIRNQFLYNYANYIKDNNDSLINRIYGIFELKIQKLLTTESIYLILMRNLYGIFNQENVVVKFDLKGSSYQREIKTNEEFIQSDVLKDENFRKRERVLYLNNNDSELVKKILIKDSEFLKSIGIMDYSLFVVKISISEIENKFFFGEKFIKNQNDFKLLLLKKFKNKDFEYAYKILSNFSFEKSDGYKTKILNDDLSFKKQDLKGLEKYIFPHIDEKYIYIMSIIDFFQLYDSQKKIETVLKSLIVEKDKISSLSVPEYQTRFVNFIEQITNFSEIIKNYYLNINEDNDF